MRVQLPYNWSNQSVQKRGVQLASAIVGLFACILLTYAYWPAITFSVDPPEQRSASQEEQWIAEQVALYQAATIEDIAEEGTVAAEGAAGDTHGINMLLIPELEIAQPIVEGDSLDVLDIEEGVWRDDRSVGEPLDGNIALAGHRLRYTGMNKDTFYHIDKLHEGSKLTLIWRGKQYHYVVMGLEEVTPSQIEVLQTRETPELTLYTCSPVGKNARRLIVHSRLISTESSTLEY